MIQVNKNVIKDYAQGRPSASQCSEWLCATYNDCSPYKFVDKRCSQSPLAVNGTVCDGTEDTEDVKAKFDFCANMDGGVYEDVLSAAQAHFDAGEPNKGGCFYPMQTEAGIICFVIVLVMMFTSMILMVKFLNRLARGSAQGCIKKALNTNGYLGILIGTGVTMLVQSSSITTATLTPMAALGLVSLENMLPLPLWSLTLLMRSRLHLYILCLMSSACFSSTRFLLSAESLYELLRKWVNLPMYRK